MRLKTGLIWITLCLVATNATAQTFPKGQRLNIGTEAEPNIRQCYKFNEYQEILKYQIDCEACKETKNILDLKLSTQQEIIDKQEQILKLKDDDIKILQGEKDRLYKMWSEENLQRHKLENKPVLGSWMGWTVAGVFAAATVFLTGWVVAN